MNIRTHELDIDEKVYKKYFRLCVFKGGTKKTTVNIPPQTQTEANLEKQLAGYGTQGINSASSIRDNAVNSISGTYNPSWSGLANNYNGQTAQLRSDYGNVMNGINNGYTSLMDGELPSTFAAARQQALQDDLTKTVGSTVNSLGSRGVLNSSVTNKALNDISQNASDTLAKQYSSDVGLYSGLLSSAANNYNTQFNNYSNLDNGTLNANTTAQNSSYTQPGTLLSYAQELYKPGSDLYNTMYNGRMRSAGQTQSTNDGGSSTWGAIGSLGSAAIIACFIAGTSISTPKGDKPIENIKIGDKVIGKNGNTETVTYTNPGTPCPIVELITDKGIVRTTHTQRFYSDIDKEPEYALDVKNIITKDGVAKVISTNILPVELVYDFATTGSNSFYANGLLAEGWD